VKYTFLSKWTVLIITVLTAVLLYLGFSYLPAHNNTGLGIVAVLVGLILYAIAWFVALFDAIQEKAWGWIVGLLLLSFIAPLLYSFLGPKNTK
jgi:hypothetical protein